MRKYIEKDVAAENPCQIILAQEVDPGFIEILRTTATRRHVPIEAGTASSSSTPAVAGVDSSSWMAIGMKGGGGDPYGGWHVVGGDEDGPTCIVAGKRSMFKSITRVEWHKSSAGQYNSRGKAKVKVQAWSRVLVAELEFWHPTAGFDKLRVASVHMHRNPAAKRPGFIAGAAGFWAGLHHRLLDCDVHIVGGDFNMSLYDTVGRLQRQGSAVTLLAAHAWRKVGEISAVAEEPGEDDTKDDQPPPPLIPPPPLHPPPPLRPPMPSRPPPDPGSPPPLPRNLPAVAGDGQQAPQPPRGGGDGQQAPQPLAPMAAGRVQREPSAAAAAPAAGPAEMSTIRCDSCGIFAVGKPAKVNRLLGLDHFTGPRTMDLEEFLTGPGYPVVSYINGIAAVEDSFGVHAAVAADGLKPFPPCIEKRMSRSDPSGVLGRGGAAHRPLAVFVGGADSRRSAPSMERRQLLRDRAQQAGWRSGRAQQAGWRSGQVGRWGGQAQQAGWRGGQGGRWDGWQ